MQRTVAGAAFILLTCLSACSKKDSSPSGIGIDGGTYGPSNILLYQTISKSGTTETVTEIHLNGDHSVAKIIVIKMINIGTGTVDTTFSAPGDTTYYTILPIYSGGRLTALESPQDSLATSGPATTIFDYSSSGTLLRIRYKPGTNSFAYDSLSVGSGRLVTTSYHFILDSTTGIMHEQYYENYTWAAQESISQILVSSIDPTSGSVSDYTVSYSYDGYFNPYRSIKDLPFMLGRLDNIIPMLSAHNCLTSQLVGYNSTTTDAYQYNTVGLPVSQNISYLVSGSVKQSTSVNFQYIQ